MTVLSCKIVHTWQSSKTASMRSWFRLHCTGLMLTIPYPNPVQSRKKFTVYPEFGGGILLNSEGLRPRRSISNPPPAINLG